MILNRLYEGAERAKLLADPSFEEQPVPFVVKVSRDGDFRGIEERRGTIDLPGRKGAPHKTKPDKGKILLSPKAHGNTANAGFARFFVDTLARVLPISDEPKSVNSRKTFWQQLALAALETGDPALQAIESFGKRLDSDQKLVERIRADVEAKKPGFGERCTFAWDPDQGKTILERDAVRDWYRNHFQALSGKRKDSGPQGLCQITGTHGPLPTSHATKISGVPGGMSSGVSVVSNDKPAFESYGLEGAANSGIGYRAAEGYTRALLALTRDQLCGKGVKTHLRVGQVLFLFWTRDPAKNDSSHHLLENPTSDEVAHLMESAIKGRRSYSAEPNDFYCLCLSGNAARAVVRDYLEMPVSRVSQNLARWFSDLKIVDGSYEGQGQATATFPLWMLANSTARESDEIPPALIPMLMTAALKGLAVGDWVLSACLRRLRLEKGPMQFRTARMALIKLCLNRTYCQGDKSMGEALSTTDQNPAYVCGRLLAFLAKCQSPRDFGAGAQVLERYFASASTTPRSIFPTLLRLNRHHLEKLRGESRGRAFKLEEELDKILSTLKSSVHGISDFPATLSLPAQGRFALGFYHQRAEYRKQASDRKNNQKADVQS